MYANHLSNNWPEPTEALAGLDSVKLTHEILPLTIIDNSTLVLPSDVQRVLPNALVEATFHMEYSQYHTPDKLNACTEGNMTQIVVLRHGN
jgi:hypothetical protein